MANENKIQIDEKYCYPIDKSKIPESFLIQFKVKNLDIQVDRVEELILNDVLANDENARIKLNRDVTPTFVGWINDKTSKKENISVNYRGSTRSGKSLVALKCADNSGRKYGKPFNTLKIVCANQKEFRLKLKNAKFGDQYQIDENAFANVGDGSMTEMQQLKDVQNIVAKENIGTHYITPRTFLPTGAEIGLAYWGKDSKNWISRFLMYSLKGHNPVLLGYVLIDVGSLYNDYGCFFNRCFGGCTNPNKWKLKEVNNKSLVFDKYFEMKVIGQEKISIDYLKHSSCIPNEFKNKILESQNFTKDDDEKMPCPFYRLCEHPLCKYEHKKDNWIDRELEGGMDERMSERFRVALELIKRLGHYDVEKEKFMLKAKSGKNMQIKINLYLPEITNTKFTKTELEEIKSIIESLSDVEVFKKTITLLKLDLKEILKEIENGDLIDLHE